MGAEVTACGQDLRPRGRAGAEQRPGPDLLSPVGAAGTIASAA